MKTTEVQSRSQPLAEGAHSKPEPKPPPRGDEETPSSSSTGPTSSLRGQRRRSCPKGLRQFVGNLILIIGTGVLFCAWVLRYTDWFEIIGGLLALSGAFTWLAFVVKIVRGRRLTQLQLWADAVIFRGQAARWLFFAVLLVGVLVAGLFVGTIQVESMEGNTDYAVHVYRADQSRGEPVRLKPGGAVRIPVWTSWWSPVPWIVKVSGYPEVRETVAPLHRAELRVPSSFQNRWVVLLRPEWKLAELLQHNPGTLEVQLNSRDVGVHTNYRGQSLWIGCGKDTDVSSGLKDQWEVELTAAERPHLWSLWAHPDSVGSPLLEVRPNDELEVKLERAGSTNVQSIVLTRSSHAPDNFIIETVIKSP